VPVLHLQVSSKHIHTVAYLQSRRHGGA